ncbi:aldo/keto reductase [Mucisphaera calidilacus]|uniref:Aldo/keto reductase family protein n=1 Tax=Mucisphaera calidilacus TaxID=2527982 RepID=A0A518BVA4_9BACT|nr:aldo/keto reductase [Mucisphaera calidilacus]QDU70912.1 Aldo/keto reductase family protein [Mucisphaera calidilacus]
MQHNRLGRTGLKVSQLGFPGIALNGQPDDECRSIVQDAVDAGITYFDIAPSYGDAQARMGPAFEQHRSRCVLNCKTTERSAEGARRELEASLEALRTDHFDVYQFHAVTTDDDVDQILAPGGAMETFRDALDRGVIHHIGLSAHNEAAAIRLIETGHIETALFPINFAAWHTGGFGPTLLEACRAHDVGVLAIKAMARRRFAPDETNPNEGRLWYLPEDREEVAHLQLRFTLNTPGVCAAITPGLPELMRLAIRLAADDDSPLNSDEIDRLHTLTADTSEPIFTA